MRKDHLISVSELAARQGMPGMRVLDASWYLPAANRNPQSEYLDRHIPGAVFFDIDAVSEPGSTLPHTLASEVDFTAAMRALGLNHGDAVVVYDTAGLFSAARAWWNLRLAGVSDVRVLSGGLPAWLAAGHAIASGQAQTPAGNFTARYDAGLVRSFAQMLALVEAGGATVLDARAAARFNGEVAEPRPGLASGHITGSRNVPFASLLDADAQLKSEAELTAIFQAAGVDLQGAVVATCGSGVTAGVVALALATLGRADIPIYDGSWSEWGARPESAHLVEKSGG